MLNPFVCGNFQHQQEEDEEEFCSYPPSATPTRRSKSSLCRSKNTRDSKNPYSTRGLDKFSMLLADLDAKRQKIYEQTGSQDISFVRFVYPDTDDCVPIVVKLKTTKKEDVKKPVLSPKSEALDKFSIDEPSDAISKEVKVNKTTKKWSFSRFSCGTELRRCYLPVAIVLILLFLAVFGRSVAILCTSMGWYLVPAMKSKRLISKKASKKYGNVGRLSNNKIASDGLMSPKSGDDAKKDKSPPRRGHRKSW